ncbi:MAG: hypothetical protein ACRC11_08155 [Xenococcaceae cyanobacterium]
MKNPNSLANLQPQAASKDKVRFNLTLKPTTIAWLKKGGNASERVDYLVDAIVEGRLVWKKD